MTTKNMNTPPGSTQENEIDLLRLVGELWDHRKFIISVTALFTLIAVAYFAVKYTNLSGRYSGPG